ncbi:family 1 glycosylhydrolase [Sphingomonas antarctica]|uniref:family 1 glycosylhydrolase n=1 Tax=Sphingomonas antarctica TaxID=2040274 RepID=UPI0039E8630A
MMIEIWGGHECTVNRVGNVYRDQTRMSGHHDRLDDLDRFAELGLRRIRYPVLWERTVTEFPGQYDWSWPDERLNRLRKLEIDPIVGLVHHGSGPAWTSLIDDKFATQLAEYAGAVAERYPWVIHWTPINEPLTTARFSALYGHWYPHAQDERVFWLALLNQIDATRLAMKAIRRVTPSARLVQTDDLGRTYASPGVQDVAEHYNERRWMSWDLLCGRVVPGHPFWVRLCDFGLEPRLYVMANEPCTPDIIGINHYVTSDRYLDDAPDGGPLPDVGYHDRVAARELSEAINGLEVAIRDCWSRYSLPIAITECHLACTREEQLRWLSRSLETCESLAADSVDVRAITIWALLGAFDWNSLLTSRLNHYESGAFDVSGPSPRPTALAALIADVTTRSRSRLPHIIKGEGWWQRDIRLVAGGRSSEFDVPRDQPILITGATGTLGRAFAGACHLRGLDYILTNRDTLAIENKQSVAAALDRFKPHLVINAAGWVRVDDAETQETEAHRANAIGPISVASAAKERGIRTVHFSSDLIFGGQRNAPWSESDTPCPMNAYGRGKAAMEAGLREHHPDALVVRTAAFFSPYDEQNFARAVEAALRSGEKFYAAADEVISPTYVPDLVNATLDLALDGECGVWHLTNGSAVSWEAFARMIARALALPEQLVVQDYSCDRPAKRPAFAALSSRRGRLMPSLASGISRYAAERFEAR